MENFINELTPTLVSLACTCLVAIAGYIGNVIKTFCKEKINNETKKRVVETTCKYVEQIYKDLKGPEKLEKAKENILLQLNEKGVPITDLELDVMIESTVNGFKDAIK